MATMSRLTSLTSLWQDSTLLVNSWSCVRISLSATVVSSWRSPRCSSSSFADRFVLITLTCFCRLWPRSVQSRAHGKAENHSNLSSSVSRSNIFFVLLSFFQLRFRKHSNNTVVKLYFTVHFLSTLTLSLSEGEILAMRCFLQE